MITTLILGAGISQDFGYPSGPKLVEMLKKRLGERDESAVKNLLEMLELNNADSIDAFIARHPENADYLKYEIAELIYGCEDARNLFSVNSFYKFFFNRIQPENFDKFRIITFNYDRSFEQYAYQNTAVKMKGDRKAALKAIEQFQITHIHGRLSCLAHEVETDPVFRHELSNGHQLHEPYDKIHFGKKELRYGEYTELKKSEDTSILNHQQFQMNRHGIAQYAIKSFKFISENGDFNKQAVSILEKSDRIIFLGFSYNEDNLRVLGFSDFKKPYGNIPVFGTGYGLSRMRREKASRFGIDIRDCTAVNMFEDHIHL